MTLSDLARSVDALARAVPFSLDDTEAANRAFACWQASRADTDRRLVEVWAYAYAHRYALHKFVRDRRAPDGFDDLVAASYLRVRDGLGAVRDAERFAAWVSVICLNAYRTYLRTLRATPPTAGEDEAEALRDEAPLPDEALDGALVRQAVRGAVARLPDALRNVARMRLLEGQEYAAIAEATGHPIPTLRVYVSKSLNLLRADPALCALSSDGPAPAPAAARRPSP